MSQFPRFAINRIMQPSLSLSDFIRLAADCQASGVEIRNDLADPSLLGGESPDHVRSVCRENDLEVLTVNALQRFNDPSLFQEKEAELNVIMETAAQVGCRMIVLCPVNDPEDNRGEAERHDDLVAALRRYGPLFEKHDMIGLVEPLGFEICSVRTKGQAVKAIRESGLSDRYRIVHDTFHHYLSGEEKFFPAETGLIHVSGVHSGKPSAEITDDDRLMVGDEDIMDNKGQIKALYAGGFSGIMSFEPFSSEVQKLSPDQMREQVRQSMEYLFGRT
jgi:2-keto-myo-inositol isomerase